MSDEGPCAGGIGALRVAAHTPALTPEAPLAAGPRSPSRLRYTYTSSSGGARSPGSSPVAAGGQALVQGTPSSQQHKQQQHEHQIAAGTRFIRVEHLDSSEPTQVRVENTLDQGELICKLGSLFLLKGPLLMETAHTTGGCPD
jgi:hypothetical protein